MPAVSIARRPTPRIGPLTYFYLSFAAFLVLAIIGINQGWFDLFFTRFPDPVAIAAAGILAVVILFIAVRQVLPIAAALASEQRAMQKLLHLIGTNENSVEAVSNLLSLDFGGDSATAETIADLRQHVNTCVSVTSRPSLTITELFDGFAGRLGIYSPRLSSSVQLLVTLGLLGTITGLVATGTTFNELPTTDDGQKAFLFTLYHGMGVVYVSAIVAWSGAAWLYLFEKTVSYAVDELNGEFWSALAGFLLPVVQSEKFFKTRQPPVS